MGEKYAGATRPSCYILFQLKKVVFATYEFFTNGRTKKLSGRYQTVSIG